MKVRLRDWASLNCISERTVQVHIKENQEELEGHIERKGKHGTWLDEYAQDFLINKIQLPNRKEIYQPTARENALMIQLNEVTLKLADAERAARENAEAAGCLKLLEASSKVQEDKIDALTRENGSLEAYNARLRGDNMKLEEDLGKAQEEAQNASKELLEAYNGFEEELKKKDARIQELENRTLAAHLSDCVKGLFRKKGKKNEKERIDQ